MIRNIGTYNTGYTEKDFEWASLPSLPPDARNKWGLTSLMNAANFGRGHKDVLKTILETDGVDVNARDNIGTTALMLACMYCSTLSSMECVRTLMNVDGVDLHMRSKSGSTALTYAETKECRHALLRVICTQLQQNKLEEFTFEWRGEVNEEVKVQLNEALQSTTRLRKVYLSYNSRGLESLKLNYSVTEMHLSYGYTCLWIQSIMKRNKQALEKCTTAAVFTELSFKSIFFKDIGKMLAHCVYETRGEKAWVDE
jgi:ankyrin repeat protein